MLGGLSLASSGFISATTAATLVADDLTGGPAASGLTLAAAILGTSAGTTLLSGAMLRFPSAWCLVASYLVAALGASAIVIAIFLRLFPLLVVGMFVLGTGQSATPLSRYVLADLHPPGQRGRALSLAVWMGTAGAIVGPNLLGPGSSLSARFEWPAYSALYALVIALFLAAAMLYAVFLVPSVALRQVAERSSAEELPGPSLLRLAREPRVRVAISSLLGGHVVMVLIMAMTPLDLQGRGHALAAVGLVISAHVIGMYAFAPVFGWLVDRFGPGLVLLVSQAALVLAAAGAATANTHTLSMVMLFLLGIGWNLGFVAGSTLLTSGFERRTRVALQGRVDTLVWISAALASASSSLLVEALGYPGLCWLALALMIVPITVLLESGDHISMVGAR